MKIKLRVGPAPRWIGLWRSAEGVYRARPTHREDAASRVESTAGFRSPSYLHRWAQGGRSSSRSGIVVGPHAPSTYSARICWDAAHARGSPHSTHRRHALPSPPNWVTGRCRRGCCDAPPQNCVNHASPPRPSTCGLTSATTGCGLTTAPLPNASKRQQREGVEWKVVPWQRNLFRVHRSYLAMCEDGSSTPSSSSRPIGHEPTAHVDQQRYTSTMPSALSSRHNT